MKGTQDTRGIERYIALDIHKEYVLAGGMNARQEWVMQARKIEMGRFREWAAKNLQEGDAVVIETTTNVWDIYDIVRRWQRERWWRIRERCGRSQKRG